MNRHKESCQGYPVVDGSISCKRNAELSKRYVEAVVEPPLLKKANNRVAMDVSQPLYIYREARGRRKPRRWQANILCEGMTPEGSVHFRVVLGRILS